MRKLVFAIVLFLLILYACFHRTKPNAVTARAINEGRAMARDKSSKGYTDMASLRKALEE